MEIEGKSKGPAGEKMSCEAWSPAEAKWFVEEKREKRKKGRRKGEVELEEEREECLTLAGNARRRDATRPRCKEKRDGERENAAQPAHGCCVLLHFVLTWCMRLLGNSPYAPFIYNSAANAGHASPHPRSVIRLRFALWNAETVAPAPRLWLYSARTFACTHIPSSSSACPSFPFFSLPFYPTAPVYFTLNLPLYSLHPLTYRMPSIATSVHGLALCTFLRFTILDNMYVVSPFSPFLLPTSRTVYRLACFLMRPNIDICRSLLPAISPILYLRSLSLYIVCVRSKKAYTSAELLAVVSDDNLVLERKESLFLLTLLKLTERYVSR